MTVKKLKPISELTRDEWIVYRWVDVTTFGDPETMVLRTNERLPDEAAQAMRDWDAVIDVLRLNHNRENRTK